MIICQSNCCTKCTYQHIDNYTSNSRDRFNKLIHNCLLLEMQTIYLWTMNCCNGLWAQHFRSWLKNTLRMECTIKN